MYTKQIPSSSPYPPMTNKSKTTSPQESPNDINDKDKDNYDTQTTNQTRTPK